MRIISGLYRSRKIHSGAFSRKSKIDFRPTSDRVRETLFNILAHRIQLENLKCLDLFSGTGSYGFEAISRGAAGCDFVDISGEAVGMITKTSEELGCSENINVIRADAIEFLKRDAPPNYDIIFADPPYGYDLYMELIRLVLSGKFKVFVLEFAGNALKNLSEFDDHIFKDRYAVIDRTIGRTCLKIFFSKT